jgi:hypothetical protein
MRTTAVLLFLCMLGLTLSQTPIDLSKIECKKCKCYQLKCSRLETHDPTCQDQYRDTCDNNEDISEEDFCNTQCDCCLETKCYKWSTYECMMFRTYEFSNITYFILITVNAFILTRLYKSMFSKDHEISIEDEEDDDERKLKNNGEVITVKYVGKLAIKRDMRALTRLNDDMKQVVSEFFDEIDKLKGVASKNQMMLGGLIFLYMILNAFHVVNIFVMSSKPLIYIYVIWAQHVLVILFWVLVSIGFKKTVHYIVKVRETIKAYEEKKNCKVNLQPKGNLIEFNFNI